MDLNRASTFVRVVETGGFTRAAEALGLPPSSVSRSVAKLEEELGITLLERTTRKVALTDAGRAYYERAREALAGLAEATALARDAASEIAGVVRIAMPPDLGATLGTLFAAFAEQQPRIRLEITFTTRGAELVGDLVELAIAFGRLPDSSLISRRIGVATSRLYAAPSYLARRGTPKKLADLARHDAIGFHAVAGEARWELVGPRGPERVAVPAKVVADHMGFAIDAAIAGLGIALIPQHAGDHGVRAGKLAPVLAKYGTETPMHVLAPATRHLPRRVALLRDYLVTGLAGHCTSAAC